MLCTCMYVCNYLHRRHRKIQVSNLFSFLFFRYVCSCNTIFPPLILLSEWTYGKVSKSDAQVMTIFCVESSVVNEIYAATDHVTGSEGRAIGLASAAWTETVTVVTVIAIWLLIPAWQSIYVDTLHREADSHITVTTFAHNLHLEVIQAAWSRYRVRRANAGSVFVCFAVTWRTKASPTHFMGIGNEIECNRMTIKSVSYKNFSCKMIIAFKIQEKKHIHEWDVSPRD